MYELLINSANRAFMSVFAKSCSDIDDSTFHLIRISQALTKREQVDLLSGICEDEMKTAGNLSTLFRLSSFATKMMDTYLKQEALIYLTSTLERPITDIIKEDKDCEIDPTKFTNSDLDIPGSRYLLLESGLFFIKTFVTC